MKKIYIGIFLAFILIPALTVSAQIAEILPDETASSTLKMISYDLITEVDIPSVGFKIERLPIVEDVSKFYDFELGNVCYLYKQLSISCIKF